MTAQTAAAVPADTAYEGTAQHCELLRGKIDRLQAALDESMSQLYASADREFRAGNVNMDDLIELYGRAKAFGASGFTRAWNSGMSVSAGQLNYYRNNPPPTPNGPGGTHWDGAYPLNGAPRPPNGVAVVYVLYAPTNDPIYLGSTDGFTARMRTHRRDGKNFTWWIAYPCDSREAAYLLEVGLLAARKPILNRKVGR